MTRIGFIGLGNMGSPMAANLVSSGYDVLGYDTNPNAVSGSVCPMASHVESCVKDRDFVITMLPDGSSVSSVSSSIFPFMSKGSLHIDCSTIDVETSHWVHELALGSGLLSLDAPVSGGVMGATNGTLSFMVGGDPDAYAMGSKILSSMGSRVIYCGDAGAGQSAKLCNNMILAITMIGTCEAFELGRRLGLDVQSLYDVISGSSGQSWSTTTYCPVPGPVPESPANRDYEAGFMVDLMVKDLNLANLASSSVSASTPMGSLALQLYEEFSAQGYGSLDFSGIIKRFEKK